MIRDRAWRRQIKDIKTISRLKLFTRYGWWGMIDVNGTESHEYNYITLLGTDTYYMCRTHQTSLSTSRDKIKFSPNRNKKRGYWRDRRKTREIESRNFLKILKENGIK